MVDVMILVILIIIWISIPSSKYSILADIRKEQHNTNAKLDRIIRLLESRE